LDLVVICCKIKVGNSNWTKWSTIQGVITRVISKLDEHEVQGQFEIQALDYVDWVTSNPLLKKQKIKKKLN